MAYFPEYFVIGYRSSIAHAYIYVSNLTLNGIGFSTKVQEGLWFESEHLAGQFINEHTSILYCTFAGDIDVIRIRAYQ